MNIPQFTLGGTTYDPDGCNTLVIVEGEREAHSCDSMQAAKDFLDQGIAAGKEDYHFSHIYHWNGKDWERQPWSAG